MYQQYMAEFELWTMMRSGYEQTGSAWRANHMNHDYAELGVQTAESRKYITFWQTWMWSTHGTSRTCVVTQ